MLGIDADDPSRLTAVMGRGIVQVIPREGEAQADPEVRWYGFDRPALAGVVSARGHRAVVSFADVVELWSTEPPRKLATLQARGAVQADPAIDAQGRVVVVPSCDPATKGPMVCRLRMFSARDGKLISEAPAMSDDMQGLRFDDAARYLLHESIAIRRVVRVEDGRELLRRVGGIDRYSGARLASYATQRASNDVVDLAVGASLNSLRTEVFFVDGDQAVVSVDDSLEIFDLAQEKTRSLVWSQPSRRFAHRQLHFLRLADKRVLNVDVDQRVARLIDYRSGVVLRSAKLPTQPHWEGILLRDQRDGKVLLCSFERFALDVSSLQVEAIPPSAKVEICRQLDPMDASRFYLTPQDRCLYQPSRATEAWQVPFASCIHRVAWRDGWVSDDDEGFEVYSPRERRTRFSFGVRLKSWSVGGPRVNAVGIVDEDVLGFADGPDLVHLTQRVMPTFPPFDGDCARSMRYQFCASRSFATRSIVVQTPNGHTQTMPLPATGRVVPIHAYGDAILARLDERPLFCQLGKGCQFSVSELREPTQLSATDLFLRGREGSAWRARDGSTLTLPAGCFAALDRAPVMFLCLDGTRSSFGDTDLERVSAGVSNLQLRDARGLRREFRFAVNLIEGEPLTALAGGGKVAVREHHRALVASWYVLSANGVVARVLADGRGAWAIYPDGKYERFGTPSEVASALWCRQGDRLVAPERCPELEVRGRFDGLK
jgi:hypothetical protein